MCSEQMKKLSVMKKSDANKNFLKVFIQKNWFTDCLYGFLNIERESGCKNCIKNFIQNNYKY